MPRTPAARQFARQVILHALASGHHLPLTMETLQNKCREVSYWTIKRAVNELVEDGIITVTHLPSTGGRPREAYFPVAG